LQIRPTLLCETKDKANIKPMLFESFNYFRNRELLVMVISKNLKELAVFTKESAMDW
jgi:hypothetical protein